MRTIFRSLVMRAFALSFALSLAACLKTRSDVREVDQQAQISHQVTTLQKENADVGARFSDLNEEIRDLRGRVEVAENKITKNDSSADRGTKTAMEQAQEVAKKNALLQEEVTRLDSQMQGLNAELQALRAELASVNAHQTTGSAASSAAKSNSWETGMDHFDNKEWKKAILAFQDYREKNPKGKNFQEATYRIGVSFQELGMKDEAKTFYDEVLTKAPGSQEAKKAKIRLAGLKAKR